MPQARSGRALRCGVDSDHSPERLHEAVSDVCLVSENPLGGGHPLQYALKLYIAGQSSKMRKAIANLREICEAEMSGRYELEVIDVLEHPQRAEEDRILATPTLVKQSPLPLRRVIGDLSNKEQLILGLELPRANDDRGGREELS